MEIKSGAGGLIAMVGGIDALFIGGLASSIGIAGSEILIWLGLTSLLIGGAVALLPLREPLEQPQPIEAAR